MLTKKQEFSIFAFIEERAFIKLNFLGREKIISTIKNITNLHILKKLSCNHFYLVRQAVAANKNIHRSIILKLSADESNIIKEELLLNPEITIDQSAVSNLYYYGDLHVHAALARHCDISNKMMLTLANHKSWVVKENLLCNTKITKEVCEILAKDYNVAISNVAKNKLKMFS